MGSRSIEVSEVAGVAEALASEDPVACARQVADLLREGADPREVLGTAAHATARRFRPALPPPHALPAIAAARELLPVADPPAAPVVQACALAASEWREEARPPSGRAVSGDPLHLGLSFLAAVRNGDADEADAIFTGLLREGKERRLAGDALFQACAEDGASGGHKLSFAVASWRLARGFDWDRGADLLRPAVRLAAGTERDPSRHGAILREIGRARLDLELAGRNVAPVEDVARNAFAIALEAGPERVITELLAGLRRGRSAAGYADLVAATAAERLVTDPEALEPTLHALAARFVARFSSTSIHILGMLTAAHAVAALGPPEVPAPGRIVDPASGLKDLERSIEEGHARKAAQLTLGIVESVGAEVVAPVLVRHAIVQDAHADSGHRLWYAAWARDLAEVAPMAAHASLAAVLARAAKSRTVFPD